MVKQVNQRGGKERGSKAFTHYWTNKTWKSNPDGEGGPLDHTAGNMFKRRGVKKGDNIYVVTIFRGKMFLGGRMVVDQILTQKEAEEELGYKVWDAKEHLVSTHYTSMKLGLRIPDGIIRQLRFAGEKPLIFQKPGILDKQTLRGVRVLTRQSAKLLDDLLGSDEQTDHVGVKIEREGALLDQQVSVATRFDDDKEPPPRVEYSMTRTVRNTPKGDELKIRYGYRCQICAAQINIPRGHYVEVHHLRPLNRKHQGLDNQDNMLVVCPLCHAQLDLGAIGIDPTTGLLERFDGGPLPKRQCHFEKGHRLAPQNVRYHWKLYRAGRQRF